MFFVRSLHIICGKRKVDLIVSQIIVILFPVSEPGKLQLKICFSISKIAEDKASVLCFFTSYFLQPSASS